MKPSEIMDGVLNARRETLAHSNEVSIMKTYINEECVVAFKKCFMGSVFLIRGKIGHFGFVFNRKHMAGWNNDLTRIDLDVILRIFQNPEGDLVIIDDNGYKEFERKVLFNGINNNEG